MSGGGTLADWIAGRLAHELHLDPAAIDRDRPVAVLGVDSLTTAMLIADLEDHLGRTLPETLLEGDPSIGDLARLLGAPPEAPPLAHRPPAPDARVSDGGRWTAGQRRLRTATRIAGRALARLDASGLDRVVPAEGPLLIAVNHLHILDALWVYPLLPRPGVFLVAAEFRRWPLLGRLLRAGQSIFVRRGQGDRQAIAQAVDALRGGAAVVIAPEGRVSRTGGLGAGHPGVARIAALAQAPVLPLGMWGQERPWRCWLRGRRMAIRIGTGPLIAPPAPEATAAALEAHAREVMRALAAALPPAYRGVYASDQPGIRPGAAR